MKKKLLALVLVVVLALTTVISGTMAYLQDTDEAVNVMTLGNVKIEQIEQEWNEQNELDVFTQGKPLYPYVGKLGWENTAEKDGAYRRFTMENVVDKYVSVKNIGKSDAYVRTIIALEMGDYSYDEFNMIGVSINKLDGDSFDFKGAWEWKEDLVAEIDGKNYCIMVAVHKDAVKPGDTTIPSLLQVYLSKDATNETVEKLDGNNNGTYDILVLSQAVQTAGFSDAETALNEGFGTATEETVKAWFEGMSDFVFANDADTLFTALKAGKDVVVGSDNYMALEPEGAVDFNAQGATVTLNGSNTGDRYHGYLSFNPSGELTLSNLNVTGTGFVEAGDYYNQGGTYTINNLVIEDMTSTLANGDKGNTLACTFCHYGTATLTDCTMTGATALVEGAIPVDAGFVNDTTTTVNGGEYGTIYCWSKATVTIEDAEVDMIYAAPNTGVITIGNGTHVGTLNLNYTASLTPNATRLAKLVIKDGATVDTIIFNGNTYTQAEWAAYVASLS